jgi:O-antigen/teichoic acid export membrane protein
VVGAGLILVGPLILGAEFRDALRLIPWFMLGGAFSGMYLAVSGLYFFHSRTAMLSLVSFPSALLGVVATMALVGTYGMPGAAMGYAITQGVLAAAAWVVARNAFALPWSQPAAALAAWRHGARPSRAER